MGQTPDDDEPERAYGGRRAGGLAVLEALSRVVSEVAGLPESHGPLRRLCFDLTRRVKLLRPLFDELSDGDFPLEEVDVRGLAALHDALVAAELLLRSVNKGSKLYQAIRRENFADDFIRVTEDIEEALTDIAYDKLDISEEVKEQIELMHAQLQRAKETIEMADLQLYDDLSQALSERHCDPVILKRISEMLQLKTMNDMNKESVAFYEMVISRNGEADALEEMSFLLKMLRDCILLENPSSATIKKKPSFSKHNFPVIPDDFQCPISLEIMKDPVIVSTGQTYERSCIQKWIESGHKTCPKTQRHLPHNFLTPNFVLKSLIGQWCEANGFVLVKKQANHKDRKLKNQSDCAVINSLLLKLQNGNQEVRRAAAGELRLLAKRNDDNRVSIAQAGAIPLLVQLFSSPDPRTHEHAVATLLNLSINESNKSIIVKANAIPKIVEVLTSGSIEARENAAATLFCLSFVDQNKVYIGEAGAIPALINLLCQGSPRGKKDAAAAIFNLCIYKGNRVKAVKAGIVVHLMRLLAEPSVGMIDGALAILAILASNLDGKTAIAQTDPLPVLVELLGAGSPTNRENAAVVLYSLCIEDMHQLKTARELGAEEHLKSLALIGPERAARKVNRLLELFRLCGNRRR